MLNLNFRGKQTTKRKKVLYLCSPSEVRLKAGGVSGDGGGGEKRDRGGGGGGGGGVDGGGGGDHGEEVDEDKEQLAGREEDHLGER